MTVVDAEFLEKLIVEDRLEEAASAINTRYRETSGRVLDVFEDFLDSLAVATVRGDLRNLAHVMRLGPPSRRSRLRRFLADPGTKNCITSILTSLNGSVPHSVKMGFAGIASFFRSSDFASAYGADIVNYEPEFSRLTDNRLIRLLSQAPNIVDLSLFDGQAKEMKAAVLEAYGRESLAPVRSVFRETASRCLEFIEDQERYAVSFRRFFDSFKKRDFVAGEALLAEWAPLGEDFFHLEQVKSSLMFPISARALYWGMNSEYPDTLRKLRELKALVTPEFSLADPVKDGDAWIVAIECRNPGSLKDGGFTIESLIRYSTGELGAEQVFRSALITREPLRSYEYRVDRWAASKGPLAIEIAVTCQARCYPDLFRVEHRFTLGVEA